MAYQIICIECEKKREPYRPVRRELDGTVRFACKKCWNALDYCHQRVGSDGLSIQTNYMYHAMSREDQAALHRAVRGIK